MMAPSEIQRDELRRFGRHLGVGGPEWAERAARGLDRRQAAQLLAWLHRRHGDPRAGEPEERVEVGRGR